MESSPHALLADIDALLNRNEATVAEQRLAHLIGRMSASELSLARPDLERLLERFFPKRRKVLSELLARTLSAHADTSSLTPAAVAPRTSVGGTPYDPTTTDVGAHSAQLKRQEYKDLLATLARYHIFQWSTAYRETVGYIFKDLEVVTRDSGNSHGYLSAASSCFTEHATEIFTRGFHHITLTLHAGDDIAIAKSQGGLQRFLFLVLDVYAARATDVRTQLHAIHLRRVTSALLVGILAGYARARFGSRTGWDILLDTPLSWVNSFPFLTASDAQELLDSAPVAPLTTDLLHLVKPILLALDRLAQTLPDGRHSLPRTGSYTPHPPRLDVRMARVHTSTHAPGRVLIFFGDAHRNSELFDEALAAGAVPVVARASPQLWSNGESRWQSKVIDASLLGSLADHEESVAERALAAMLASIETMPASAQRAETLSHNFAAEFPLSDAHLRQFYLVERHSVRSLLDTFSHGTGAHVWCSVRRSGKTTSTLDLAGDSDDRVVVFQTMDHQPERRDLNLLYTRVMGALESNGLAPDFFDTAVRECSLATSPAHMKGARRVLIIDEYETLFGLLNARAQKDDWLRYAVVQPLLSQMVSFAQSNLLVFLGQRPDAHFILMTQNQLSPLVRQDSFPLFSHQLGGKTTEFAQFVSRVLTEQLPFTHSFVDALHAETSGHPYLTVNVLVDFCDWLIANNRPMARLSLTADDVDAFIKARFSPAVLQRSSHYSTFQHMIANALSEATREREPWLYAIHVILQRICKQHPRALSCSEPRYKELADDVARLVSTTPGQLLQSASMANFVTTHSGQVRPTIRVLGRLAAVAVSEVN